MVGQLSRSKARKQLTALCSVAIIQLIRQRTNPESSKLDMQEIYLSSLNITLGNAVEEITKKNIPQELVKKGRVLSLFEQDLDDIQNSRKESSIIEVRNFIADNYSYLAEEDLGGISELFSGHKAIWINDDVKLVHDSARRDSGKIYTPYDVTNYMCNTIATKMLRRCDTIEDLMRLKVLDPAVGSGAFCAQLVRILSKKSSRKWRIPDTNKFRYNICKNVIYCADIDSNALKLAKVVLWISAGCPDDGLKINMSNCDSLGVGSCEEKEVWKFHTGFELKDGFDVVFGNPPYVRVKPEELAGFAMAKTRNLYCAFTELGLNLLNNQGLLCFIVPQSIVISKETMPLRKRLIEDSSSLRMQTFDSVPDFLFDQGKIESNTNTNINQRTTIVTLDRTEKNSVFTSPLLRWRRREERDYLFNNLKQIRISKKDIHNGAIPMLENRDDLVLFRKLNQVSLKISDSVVKENGRVLFIPKAIRYFITAVPFDLERPNTIQLHVSEENYHLVHSIVNSNLFYWWWRVNGNGFQVEMKDILSFPLLPLPKDKAREFSKKLDESVDECRVFKHNAGKQIPNINYNYKQELLQQIDVELLKTLDLVPHERIFLCKTNSLFGNMDALRGYKVE